MALIYAKHAHCIQVRILIYLQLCVPIYIYIYICLDGHLGIGDWDFTLFEQCETHKQLKERETFWQHRLKTFYPLGLNEKEEYLY